MLVSLLLFVVLARVTCEWVEISQQHYLKPARTTRDYPQRTVSKDFGITTKANRVYPNTSLSNPNWNKGAIYKVPSSEVKRLINGDTIRSKPINIKDNPTGKLSKKSPERVYYNKDNVRRITFTSEESLKPLEVLNLSDLDYDEDEFPTIEIDDGTFSSEDFEHTKHLTVVIPTEDEEDHTSDNLPNTVQSHSKNHDRKSLFTKAPLKKDLKIERKPFARQNITKSFQKESDGHSKSVDNSNTDILSKVVKLKDKSSSTSQSTYNKSEKIKQEEKYINKNSLISHSTVQETEPEKNNANSKMIDSNKLNRVQKLDSSSETSSHKLKLEKNVLKIDELPKRSKIRNPEEVMLEEILHESYESLEDLKHTTPNIGTVKKVHNKSTITKINPKINESEGNDFKPVESQIQVTKNKHIETVNTSREIVDKDNNNQKNIIKQSVTTTTESSKTEESKGFEAVQLNSPTPVPVKKENLFDRKQSKNPKEDRSDIVTSTENNYNDEQEKQKLFILTATSNQEESTTKVKSLTETTATVKVEFTTKAPHLQQITTPSDEEEQSDKLDSKTPPVEKNVNQEHKTEETLANDTTTDILSTLVKVLKLVTETIARNTRKTIRGKMRYLEELRDTIMASIEQRLEAMFPDDEAATARRARSAHAHAHGGGRGHVEFPSSESALMTISFLTFAVFLIKLVLQVIQAYKHKAMVPAVLATVGRAYRHFSHTNGAGDEMR